MDRGWTMARRSRAHSSDVSLGQIYAFRTAPFTRHSPPNTGRFAAIKILGVDARSVAVAVLDGTWETAPSLLEVSKCGILRQHRFAGEGRLATFGTHTSWWNIADLVDASIVGLIALTETERDLGQRIMSFSVGTSLSTINYAPIVAEGEWRWKHDRESLLREYAKQREEDEAQRSAKQKLYETRLRGLTWDQILSETPFERWSPSPPFPPKDFTERAREAIHDACRDLKALGPKPRKREVRAVLKRCVEWFNEADRRADHPIETDEREDICAVLAELAYVARHEDLAEEIDDWREW